MKNMYKEIKSLEKEILKRSEEVSEVTKKSALRKIKGKFGAEETSYIG